MSAVAHADDTTFDREVLESDVPVIVDFWASRCGPCRVVVPELEALAAEHGDALTVVKVHVDAAPSVAGRYGVQGIPAIARFRDGAPVAVTVGAKPRRAIEADLGLARPAAS